VIVARTRAGTQIILCLLVLGVAGCGTKATRQWLNRIAPREDDALARGLIDALLREDFEFMARNMDESILGKAPETTLRRFYLYIDHDPLQSVELVGCRVLSIRARRQSSLMYQLEFPGSWYAADFVIAASAGTRKVIGLQLKKLPASLAQINRFTLKGRGLVHYALLLGAIGVPVLMLYALIQCLRTRVKWKWLWIPFILVGIGSIHLNWTTAQLGFQPLSLLIPGTSLTRGGLYAPWVLSVSFPLGAVLFLKKRRKLNATVPSDVAEGSHVEEARPQTADDGLSPADMADGHGAAQEHADDR